MRHHLHLLCLAASALIILTACSNESSDTTDSSSPAAPKQADPAPTSNDTATADASADILALGAAAWKQGNCTMCHSSDGSGNRFGPDLTDSNWNNCDGSIDGIRAVLVAGIPKEKFHNTSFAMAMPAATSLVPEQDKLDALAAYVKNLSADAPTNE